jgi:microcin C transport system ATP-binding protein
MNRTPLLGIRDLSVDFDVSDRAVHAVRNVSLDIYPGETVALVGESGSGKSVTAHAVLRLLPYPQASHPSGRILFEERDLLSLPERELRGVRGNRIGMIFQEPLSALNPLHNVEKQIGEVLAVHKGMRPLQARARVLELLDLVGIKDGESRLGSFPHELSGGQRQRVMIAMALANDPDLLIADEPTTALDVTVQARVLELLKDLQRRMGLAVLLITHDLGVVRHVSDRVAVMKDGELVETAPTKELFQTPTHPYTRELLAADPGGEPNSEPEDARTLLEARDVRVWFPIKKGIFKRTVDHFKAVEAVSLTLKEGGSLGIVGESGSGKTTLGLGLLRLIASTGAITFDGHRLDRMGHREVRGLRREMQFVFQDPFGSLSPRMTVDGIIREGLALHYPETEQNQEVRIIQALEDVGLDPDTRHRFPHEFSGGQRQRIAIARALVLRPRLVVMDEPTSALDRAVQFQVVELLRDLQCKYGLAYLFITHDLKIVKALCRDILVMREGKVVEQGPAERIFSTPETEYTRTLLAAAFE